MVRGAVSAPVAATVEFCQSTDANVFAEVYVPCNGSCSRPQILSQGSRVSTLRTRTGASVIPIGIIRRKLLERTSFNEVNPDRNLEFSGALQVGSIGGDESLCAVDCSGGISACFSAGQQGIYLMSRTPGMFVLFS